MPSLPPARATVRLRGVVRSRPFTTPRAPLSLPLLRRPHLYLFIHHPWPLWILCSFSSDNLCIMPSIDCIAYYLPPSVCCIITFLYLSLSHPCLRTRIHIHIHILCIMHFPFRRESVHEDAMRAHERPRRDCHPRARRSTVDRPHIPGPSGRRPRLHDRDAQRSLDHRAGARTGKGKETALGHRPPARARVSALHICCAPPEVLSELACLRPCVESVPGALARRGRASPQAFYRPCSAYTHPLTHPAAAQRGPESAPPA